MNGTTKMHVMIEKTLYDMKIYRQVDRQTDRQTDSGRVLLF